MSDASSGLVVVASPLLLTVDPRASRRCSDRKLAEETTTRLVHAAIVSGLLAAGRHAGVDADRWARGTSRSSWATGSSSRDHYHFSVKFVFDRLSVPFAILSFVLSGTIGAFASRYLHRERGFNRFFVLYAIFVLGMVVTSLAGTIETLFAGWELVGLSSALLVAFFQERPAPARNGLWVWVVYRVSDAALLLAAVAMHHLRGEGDFDKLLGSRRLARRAHRDDPVAPGARRRAAAAGGRGRQVGAGAVLGLAAAGDGGPDAVERRVLRRPVGPPRRLPAAAGQPAPGAVDLALRGDRRAGADHRGVRLPGRQRADGHQVGPVVRLADAGRDHRRRDRPGLPLHRAGPPAGPRLPADAAVRAGADAAARLPHAGERHRRAPAAGAGRPGCGRRPTRARAGCTGWPSSAATSTRS